MADEPAAVVRLRVHLIVRRARQPVRENSYRTAAPSVRAPPDIGWHVEFPLLRGERILLSCGATPSFFGDGKLFLTDRRLIHTPRRAPLGQRSWLTRVHIWDKDDIETVEVVKGQPLLGNPSGCVAQLLLLPIYLLGFAILTVVTIGIFPVVWAIVWLKDRMTGTYLVIETAGGIKWFYLKSTSLEEADRALDEFTSGED